MSPSGTAWDREAPRRPRAEQGPGRTTTGRRWQRSGREQGPWGVISHVGLRPRAPRGTTRLLLPTSSPRSREGTLGVRSRRGFDEPRKAGGSPRAAVCRRRLLLHLPLQAPLSSRELQRTKWAVGHLCEKKRAPRGWGRADTAPHPGRDGAAPTGLQLRLRKGENKALP